MRLYGMLAVMTLLTSQASYASAAGRTTTPIANTILNGKGAPKSALGHDGDFYIDTRSLLIYGPKIKGKWPSPQSIQGPTGPAGSDGKNGADGRAVTTNATAINGTQGPIGPQGEKGERGEKGETGTAGSPGLPGAMGAAGSPGPAGPAGSNGATGPQGPAGPTGPSEVTVVDIPTWTLATTTSFGFSESSPTGTLLQNKSYKFEAFVYGASTSYNLALGLEASASNASLSFSYIKRENWFVTSNSTVFKYAFLVEGTVSSIQANSGIVIRIIDAYGETGAAPLTLTGKAYITLVGSIR
jgi:hypothetical protein